MAGIYIHIPFCKQKCSYCDFHFRTGFHSYRERMISAICTELHWRSKELSGQYIETIYFGGGTPSLLTADEIHAILNTIKKHYQLHQELECTLEANPDDLEEMALKNWLNAGINRLSIGLQSFDDRDLIWMNRAHTASQSLNCIKMAQDCGFNNISIDLIYGLPDLDEHEWQLTLQKALNLNIQHISAYCLTVEERTELAHRVKLGELTPADQDMQSIHFDLLHDCLTREGFTHYEVSNFAVPGFESKHNANYWRGIHYIGIGPSAHSFDGCSRGWNIANNHLYMKSIEAGNLPLEKEVLSPKDQFNELLLTGLRTIWGVSLTQLGQILPLSEPFYQKMNQWCDHGKGQIIEDHFILNAEGLRFADGIAQDLFAD